VSISRPKPGDYEIMKLKERETEKLSMTFASPISEPLIRQIMLLFASLIVLIGCSDGITYGRPKHGLVCGIRLSTRVSSSVEVFLRNEGSTEQVFSIDESHYEWADLFVDGKHVDLDPMTAANRAMLPKTIRIAPGELRQLPDCTISALPPGNHSVSIKYWLNRSPCFKAPADPPFFESGEIRMNSQ
jgi:hypothetical protein